MAKDEPQIDVDDLQAAIDASAQATVDFQKDKKTPDSDSKPEKSTSKTKTSESKPKKKTTTKAAKAPASNDSEEHQVPVKIQKVSAGISQASAKPEAASNDDETKAAPEQKTMSHTRGLTIKPLSASESTRDDTAQNTPDTAKTTEDSNKPAASASSSAATPAKSEGDETKIAVRTGSKPAAQSVPNVEKEVAVGSPKQDESVPASSSNTNSPEKPAEDASNQSDDATPADESKDTKEDGSIKIEWLGVSGKDEDQKPDGKKGKTAKDSDADPKQNEAKIFDTKEYHLPIKPSRHHRNGEIPLWLAIVVLLLVIVGIALFAQMTEIINLADFVPNF